MHKPTVREQYLYVAKIAEQSERYQDMLEMIKKVVSANSNLSTEELNLLSTSYKQVVTKKRTEWQVLNKIVKKQKESGSKYLHLLITEKEKIKNELDRYCHQIIDMVDYQLVQNAPNPQMVVFYLKIKGDFSRYIAEFTEGQERTEAVEFAQTAYTKAITMAQKQLKAIDPIRLGLALNFSVFYAQVHKDLNKAIEIASQAFEEAVEISDKMDVSRQDETLEVMQFIDENLSMWREELKQ